MQFIKGDIIINADVSARVIAMLEKMGYRNEMDIAAEQRKARQKANIEARPAKAPGKDEGDITATVAGHSLVAKFDETLGKYVGKLTVNGTEHVVRGANKHSIVSGAHAKIKALAKC